MTSLNVFFLSHIPYFMVIKSGWTSYDFNVCLISLYRMSEISDSPSQALSQLLDTPRITLEDDFLNMSQRKTIDQSKECKEVYYIFILAFPSS